MTTRISVTIEIETEDVNTPRTADAWLHQTVGSPVDDPGHWLHQAVEAALAACPTIEGNIVTSSSYFDHRHRQGQPATCVRLVEARYQPPGEDTL